MIYFPENELSANKLLSIPYFSNTLMALDLRMPSEYIIADITVREQLQHSHTEETLCGTMVSAYKQEELNWMLSKHHKIHLKYIK